MVWPTIYDEIPGDEVDPCHPPQQLVAAQCNNFLDHCCELDINSAPAPIRRCSIICTIGPSSREPETILKMIETGMSIARLNFSHGSHEYHAETVKNIRTAVDVYSKMVGLTVPVAIALDTKGPEIRTGLVEGGGSAEIELKKGDLIKLTTDKAYEEKGNVNTVFVDYENIQKVVQVGNRVYLDDGLISLMCTAIQGSVLTCVIENGGKLGSRKGVNLPGVPVDLPAVSEKDRTDIRFAVDQQLDMIFASFIRDGTALTEIRDILGPEGKEILVISKIENQQGMDNLDEIIKASDGVMIARGDLGIEIPTEKVFIAQKSILARCNRVGKPIICATQMLESMTYKPRPTRAEGTDVANAILDGADCVMLSGETAKGSYPLECVRIMASIAKEAEAALWHRQHFVELVNKMAPPLEPTHAVAIGAVQASIKAMAAAIIVVTISGRSAQLVAKYKPRCPILAITKSPLVARQTHLFRACLPLIYEKERLDDWKRDVEDRVMFGINFGKWKGFIKAGDPVVVLTPSKRGSGYTDTMRVIYASKPPPESCGCDYP